VWSAPPVLRTGGGEDLPSAQPGAPPRISQTVVLSFAVSDSGWCTWQYAITLTRHETRDTMARVSWCCQHECDSVQVTCTPHHAHAHQSHDMTPSTETPKREFAYTEFRHPGMRKHSFGVPGEGGTGYTRYQSWEGGEGIGYVRTKCTKTARRRWRSFVGRRGGAQEGVRDPR